MLSVRSHDTAPVQFWGKGRGVTERQGSPTEFDLDVVVATLILSPVLPFFLCLPFCPVFVSERGIKKHAVAVLLPQSCPFP